MKTKIQLKKVFCVVLSLVLLAGVLAGCAKEAPKQPEQEQKVDFPTQDLAGIVQWGAGGGTDTISRAITPLAEKYLGRTIVMQNKTGATGAIATQFVYDQKADGHTLLFGAENPQLYQVMDISKLTYKDFEPVILTGYETAVIVVPADSKFNNIHDLLDEAKANPGKIKLGTTGPGGLPFVVASFLKTVSEVEFNQIPFDGDGPVLTALLGGHVEVTIVKMSIADEMYKAGKIKVISAITDKPMEGVDVAAIGQEIPAYNKYLPWGLFYGVFVKKETPEETKQILKDAFRKAFEEEQFQSFLKGRYITPLGTSGKEAEEFLDNWQSVSAWLLYDAGGAPISPEKFGIKRVE
ncbi:Bug family tripartite tricarboxylate transporter substrate binding protein [Geosporobacter ferrireducens]|uniref:Bug family tripartite tricarboxylate transporter substrate binding protein n=1 Tax=Geosporobacter ferrireducens TaxID=1424294 RepID=UPI000A43F575|nr:tripartite tricarboxylate transporter substrate binding protein [Geosporobacter ferrireducens]